MKKMFQSMPLRHLFAGAALLGLFAACERQESPVPSETVEVEMTAGLPASLTSYAGGALPEGGLSNLGGAYNVDPAQYDLRYIMEAWTDETPSRLAFRRVVTVDDNFLGTSVTFKARLIAMEYHFLFWADFVPQGKQDDNVYKTDSEQGLMAVSIAADRAAGNEYADAYYAAKQVDLTESGQSVGKVELVRPFGKIRMIARDVVDGELPDRPGTVQVDYDAQAKLPNVFNVLTGKASGSVSAGSYTFDVYTETARVDGYEPIDNAYILGSDYIFASDAGTAYAFGVKVYSSEDPTRQIGAKSLSQIPLQANKLTTLIGNFYSNEGDVEIIISDAFTNPEEVQ